MEWFEKGQRKFLNVCIINHMLTNHLILPLPFFKDQNVIENIKIHLNIWLLIAF